MNHNRFITLFSPATLCCLLLFLALPLAMLLPAEWGKENGPVENTQVVVILITGLVAYGIYKWGVGSRDTKLLYLYTIPLIMIVAARELSWGRVFYPDGHGWILPLKALWFGKFVYPVLGFILVAVIIGLFLQKLDKEILLWVKYGRFPILDILMIIGGFLAADLVEHHSYGFFAQRQELFEESFELIMYCGVLSLFINLGFNKLFQPAHHLEMHGSSDCSKSRISKL